MGASTNKPSNNIVSRSLALTYQQVYNETTKKWELDQDSINGMLAYTLMNDNVKTGDSSGRIPPEDIPQNTRSQLKTIITSFEEIVADI